MATDNQALLAELNRVEVLFQGRAIAAAMGLPAPAVKARMREDEHEN